MVTFKTFLENFQSELWGYHIKIPNKYAISFIEGTERRVMCRLNEGDFFHAGLIPNKEFGYFININKNIRNSLYLSEGEEVIVTLKEDNSKYGIEVSDEFLACIEMDPEAAHLFHELTAGKQRSLIYMANKPRLPETRMNKALTILEFLKINNGNLDFKLLMQAFRESA